MFVILIIGQVYIEYSGIAKKEYQLVARFINILALSIAIILIMVVLLQWFHPPAHLSNNIVIAMIPTHDEKNNSSKQERIRFETISADDPSYLKAIGVQRRSMLTYHQNIHHGPNLFFAAFIMLFIALLGFVMAHRMSN
jgi:amino acid transporter